VKPIRVGTGNPGKLREFRQILEPLGYDVRGIDDLETFEVIEDGDTFDANAIKKAQAVVDRTGEPAVADDSGLVVDALGGAPGVHSARWAGVGGDRADAANRDKLVREIAGVPEAKRSARFVCVLAYCEPGADPTLFRGEVEGRIIDDERGSGGFGYDPLFLVPERGLTTAEMLAEEKNAISHRGRALRALVAFLTRRQEP
jgi:XTP/dITP diphosphohydrolase